MFFNGQLPRLAVGQLTITTASSSSSSLLTRALPHAPPPSTHCFVYDMLWSLLSGCTRRRRAVELPSFLGFSLRPATLVRCLPIE